MRGHFMNHRRYSFGALVLGITVFSFAAFGFSGGNDEDRQLRTHLRNHNFSGKMQSRLVQRLGRPIDQRLANIGRLLWFDTLTGLNNDNSCGGCHSPTAGFGDTQSIAIGIDNNNIVGPHRKGPRNQRRTPLAINTAFYPKLMWNGRFVANSGDPFDPSEGFTFPLPEGTSLSNQTHLLRAQAFIPPTERNEAAGFAFPGANEDIRNEVVARLNATPNYRQLFGHAYPSVRGGRPISYDMFAAAIAEFEFTQTYADAPIDRFARGENNALNGPMTRGANLFFGKAKCVSCHSVDGESNEMFSDFRTHVAAIPQIVPSVTNSVFDGPRQNEDFGLEQVTGNPADRYKFRSSPLRNIALQPTFFHNGAFKNLRDAIKYHMDPAKGMRDYRTTGLDSDLRNPLAPMQDALARLSPIIKSIPSLSNKELDDLTEFVKFGLLDQRARPERLMDLIPRTLPSGRRPMVFERP